MSYRYRELLPGDPAPVFTAPTLELARFAFDTVAGVPCAMMFFGSAGHPVARRWVEALLAREGEFDGIRRSGFGVSLDPADFTGAALPRLQGMRFFLDRDGSVNRDYGALPRGSEGGGQQPLRLFTVVLDARLRVVASIAQGDDPRRHVEQVFAALDALAAADAGREDDMPAPVLTVPRVFEPSLCERLIAYYRERGGEESGFMREMDGRTVGVYDHGFKRRKDCTIESEELLAACRERIVRRLVPAVKQAFQFEATRIERWIVARYDGANSGFFRCHRDNTTGATAHRQFAVSLHLNGGFSGGGVRFPEFGPRVYNPPAGGALVFSCALLHEALPVSAGERFVFLPFLYGEQAARVRSANQDQLAGNINSPEDA